VKNLREEFGDILTSVLQGIHEQGWDPEDLIKENLNKINRRLQQYKSLGRKTKIVIYGGAYDPPTIGHLKVAQFVLNTSRTFDYVYVCPAFQHIYDKKMQSPEHRLEMCRIAFQDDPRIKIFPYEIDHQLRGETYHFVVRLLEEPDAKDLFDFSLIMGIDNANTFDKWVNYNLLEKMIRFVVVPRRGVLRDPNVDWYLKPPHIYLHGESDIPETSSTSVRNWLKKYWTNNVKDERLSKSLDPRVFDYITTNNLYKD
jgi:nicotinate-nucleotide adenylyltransferase